MYENRVFVPRMMPKEGREERSRMLRQAIEAVKLLPTEKLPQVVRELQFKSGIK